MRGGRKAGGESGVGSVVATGLGETTTGVGGVATDNDSVSWVYGDNDARCLAILSCTWAQGTARGS